jgi:hypothetical protein
MKRTDLKKLIKENITDWLSERATTEADSGDMAYTEKATVKEEKSTFDDKVTKDGNIYVVVKPDKNTEEGGIVKSMSLESLIDENCIGAYTTGEKALAAGKKALKARDAGMKETYKKGQDKLKELEGSLDELKGAIEKNMAEATSNPTMRETLQTKSNSLLEKLTQVEAMIEKLRGGLEKEGLRLEKKKPSKDKKDDSKKDDKKSDKKDDKKKDK